MIGTIIRKEIAANLLSYKFFIVILLASVLIFTSLFVMVKDFKGRQADYQLNKPKSGEPIAIIPPNPLSIFAKGLDDAMTRSFGVGSTGIDVQAGQQSGNIVFSFFPAPDFLYVVKVVLSLVALLFGFDQISREKEAGTLKLMFANSLSRASVLAGKWLGNFLSLAVPFLLVTMLGIVLMNLDSAVHLSASGLGRLAFLLATSLIYIGLFLSLGVFISTVTRRSASSLVVLLFIWSLLVFVLPNLGTLVARQLVDVPSVKAMSEKRQQSWPREILLAIVEGRAAGRGAGEGNRKAHLEAINTEFDKLENDYRLKFDRLVRLSKTINRLSPAASFVYAATELAGTGIGEESRLKDEIIRYKNTVFQEFAQDRKDHAAFTYRYRSAGQALAQGGMFDFGWLAAFTVVLFGLGFAAFVRYDVR